MERYNIFQLIHKGLRAALYQTALQLQQADFTDEQETENVINKVKEVVMLFEGHAHKEDRFVFSAISAYEPSVVASFESEHEEDIVLGQQLNESVAKLETVSSLLQKIVLGGELTEAFVSFMAFNLRHMSREEDIINKILWRYYSDDEIRKINAQILQATPPWIQEFYMTWMLRGINDTEAINWMKTVGKNMPELVFQTLIQKAEREWPGQRFRKIAGSIVENSQHS